MSKDEKFPIIPNCTLVQPQAVERKRRNEKLTFLAMAGVYCKGNGHEERVKQVGGHSLPPALQEKLDRNAKRFPAWKHIELCPECLALVQKAEQNTQRCPHMAYKSFCHRCPRPCYAPAQMARISPLMRYAGPRLILHHPVLTVWHWREMIRSKKIIKKYQEESRA